MFFFPNLFSGPATAGAAAAEAAEAAEAAVARHQEALARLTADNMVFLMRLKGAEAELGQARRSEHELRAAAEKSEGKFFDRARAEVERAVQQ
eukprot:414638-Prorocentrum_minimum.AAC.1